MAGNTTSVVRIPVKYDTKKAIKVAKPKVAKALTKLTNAHQEVSTRRTAARKQVEASILSRKTLTNYEFDEAQTRKDLESLYYSDLNATLQSVQEEKVAFGTKVADGILTSIGNLVISSTTLGN